MNPRSVRPKMVAIFRLRGTICGGHGCLGMLRAVYIHRCASISEGVLSTFPDWAGVPARIPALIAF